MLSINQSVGHLGRNRPEDVAVIQYMLRRWTRPKDGRPYFKGVIDGAYGGALSGAVIDFYNDFLTGTRLPEKDMDEIKKTPRTFTPRGNLYKWLALWTSDDPVVRKAKVIPGTSVLYFPEFATGKRRDAHDYLIPSFMRLPRTLQLGSTSFDIRIDHVEFFESAGVDYRFSVHITLMGIGAFVEPKLLKVTRSPTADTLNMLNRRLHGGSWSVQAFEPDNRVVADSHFYLHSRNIAEFGQSELSATNLFAAMSGLAPRSDRARIYWDDQRKRYGIPPKDKLLNVVGRIHAAACINSGRQGGYVRNRPLETYALTVLEEKLGKNAPLSARRYCESCQVLGASIITGEEKLREIDARMNSLKILFQQAIKEISSSDEFKQAQEQLGKAGANLVPIVGDALFNVDRSDTERLMKLTADSIEMQATFDPKSGRFPQTKVSPSRIIKGLDLLAAMGAILQSSYYISAVLYEEEAVRRRFEKFELELQNLWLEREAEEVRLQGLERDYEARNCKIWQAF